MALTVPEGSAWSLMRPVLPAAGEECQIDALCGVERLSHQALQRPLGWSAGRDGGKQSLRARFSASRINDRWVSDITYIGTSQGTLYLAVVMDLYSRRIVAGR